jgi:hypothetical protein
MSPLIADADKATIFSTAALAEDGDVTSSSMARRSTPCSAAYFFDSATLAALRPAMSRILA